MAKYDERTCTCSMNRIFGFNPRAGRAIMEHFGSAAAVFSDGGRLIREALPYTKGTDRITDMEYEISEKELEHLGDATFIGIGEQCYPALLRECNDAPLGLYVKSDTEAEKLFHGSQDIAVIGTRDISPYGKEWCERIVSAVADTEDPPAIVSGLAIGADITAHRKALERGIRTIAVMATGIDRVYPHMHGRDAERIRRTEGCALITDYPPGTSPMPVNFLRRNRIIAGMCRSAILIESKAKGGGMMTSRLAFSYGRDVYALPGRADDLRSQGCNMLIRQKVAESITDTATLMKSLGLEMKSCRSSSGGHSGAPYYGRMPEDKAQAMSRILLTIKRNRDIDISSVAVATGMDYGTAAGYIGILEADGFITVDFMQRCRIRIK